MKEFFLLKKHSVKNVTDDFFGDISREEQDFIVEQERHERFLRVVGA